MMHRRHGDRRGVRSVASDPKYDKKSSFPLTKQLVSLVLLLCGFVLVFYLAVSTERNEQRQHNMLREKAILADKESSGNKEKAGTFKSHTSRKEKPNLDNLIHHLDDGSEIGYIKVPTIAEGERTGDDGKLHIIFSSGCNYFQHWQSEFVLASAHLVGQRGRITRIVSGCHDKRAENVQHRHQTFPSGTNDLIVPMEQLKRSVNPNFGLYVTPSFEGAIDFPWINKPSSIQYFMEHARPELDRLGETVVVILDPDFVFVRPLTQMGEDPELIIATRGQAEDDGINNPIDMVKEGRPVAQRYGLEGGWVAPKYNLDKITGDPNTPAKQWSYRKAAFYTSVGPPLMLHVNDLTKLSVLWERYMRPVLDVGKDILADMWAYSIAAAHLDLKHTMLDNYMISTWGDHGEAFQWIADWTEMSCRNPQFQPGKKAPVFIHLASNFKAFYPDETGKEAEWMFHKGHVPATILDCDTPLLIEAPDELFNYQIEKGKSKHDKQRAWILCNTVARLNQIALLYKQKYCPKGFEQRKLVRLIQSKKLDRGCSQKRDKWCYPLAQIEGLPNGWRDHLG